MSRVLVTGGTGFVGRHSVAALERAGHEVHVVSSSRTDLLDGAATSRLVESVRPERLLHLAWDVTPGRYLTSDSNARWAEASMHLLREFSAHGERAVLAGTCFEYAPSDEPLRERESPLGPATPYARCKDSLRAGAEALGLPVAWGRIFFLYGPAEYPTRLVASVARALLRGEPAPVSHGRQLRDYLHSADAGEAFAALVDSDVEGPVNVASGEGVTLAELVGEVGRAAGRPDLIRLGERPAPPDEPPAIVADAGRLRDEVGWRPARSLPAGIDETVAWWRDELQRAPTPSRSDSIM